MMGPAIFAGLLLVWRERPLGAQQRKAMGHVRGEVKSEYLGQSEGREMTNCVTPV